MQDLDDTPAPIPAVHSALRDVRIGEESRPKHATAGESRQQHTRGEFYSSRVERLAALRPGREALGISLFEEDGE